METAARETPASRAAVPKIPGSLREEPDLPSGILILPFHPPNRSSHRPGAMMRGCKVVSGSFAAQIRRIVVLTDSGAMDQNA